MKKVKEILRHIATVATLLALAAQWAVSQLAQEFSGDWVKTALDWLGKAAVWLAAIAVIARKAEKEVPEDEMPTPPSY